MPAAPEADGNVMAAAACEWLGATARTWVTDVVPALGTPPKPRPIRSARTSAGATAEVAGPGASAWTALGGEAPSSELTVTIPPPTPARTMAAAATAPRLAPGAATTSTSEDRARV